MSRQHNGHNVDVIKKARYIIHVCCHSNILYRNDIIPHKNINKMHYYFNVLYQQTKTKTKKNEYIQLESPP